MFKSQLTLFFHLTRMNYVCESLCVCVCKKGIKSARKSFYTYSEVFALTYILSARNVVIIFKDFIHINMMKQCSVILCSQQNYFHKRFQ